MRRTIEIHKPPRGGPRGKEPRSAFDWNEIHRRLESAQTVLERDSAMDPGKKREILKARAQMLARKPEEKREADQSLEILAFLLGRETYAIESHYVREVCPLKELTPVPCTPPFVLGIVNLRGQMLSVIDFKKFFDLPEEGLTDLNKIIVLQAPEMELGILADAILGVRSIPNDEIQASLPTLTGIRADYLKGVTKSSLVILAAEKLLSDKRIVVHQEVEI